MQLRSLLILAPVAATLVLSPCRAALAESHRATRLGHPATRFAPPLTSPEDMRERFRDPRLHGDFDAVLTQWGWSGRLIDLFQAAAQAEISDIKIPVGSVMPFMSSREAGQAICLRNVTWAGQEPAPAYAFHFSSNGRRYRCVMPKACSNFFLEELGDEPRRSLVLECSVPEKVFFGRRIETCLTLRNAGNVAETNIVANMPIPAGATLLETSDEGRAPAGAVLWQLAELPPGATKKICAVFKAQQPGNMQFQPTATASNLPPAQSSCATSVMGLSALLLEKADDPDPVAVGDTTTYTVKVTNQGSADDTNVKMVVEFPEELEPLRASHSGEITGKTVTFPAFPRLAPKQAFSYTIVAKGSKAGDARVRFVRTSDDTPAPTMAEESTTVY